MSGTNDAGKITDEGIARLRARIGKGFPGRRPWRTEATRDAIYHLALAIGDLSPLYLDEEYARRTRWGTLIAPPIIVNSMDTLRAVGSSGLPEGLPGVHSIWTGSRYEWERSVRLGDRVTSESYLKEIVERESEFGEGAASTKPTRRSTTTRMGIGLGSATTRGSGSNGAQRERRRSMPRPSSRSGRPRTSPASRTSTGGRRGRSADRGTR